MATKSANELVAAKVEAVIGPFTSSMAEVIVPITAKAGIFQVSPTITSMDFYGKNDNLFRINRTKRDNARDYARVLVEQARRQAPALPIGASAWAATEQLVELGGSVVKLKFLPQKAEFLQ